MFLWFHHAQCIKMCIRDRKDSVMLAVFPLTQGKGIIRKVQEVKSDIEQECEQYE